MNTTLSQLFSFVLFFLVVNFASAQCPDCVIDPNCAASLPDGGICPSVIPDAINGEYYEESITFFIPENLSVQGFDVEVRNITIASLEGIPFDVEWQCDRQDVGCFYDITQGQDVGCATICGTPLTAPGEYIITITINAVAFVPQFGIELAQPQTFTTSVTVLEGSGCPTYSFSGEPDCSGNYEVDFSANVDGSPNITKYAWDFGNGETSTLANPPTQVFPAPGAYDVSLETQICGYTVTTVNLNSMNDNWCGDVEEVSLPFGVGCTANPDPYFEIRDASGSLVYRSSTKDDVNSASWSGLNIQLNNPPYVLCHCV